MGWWWWGGGGGTVGSGYLFTDDFQDRKYPEALTEGDEAFGVPNGKPLFQTSEFLTVQEINSFFSRPACDKSPRNNSSSG